MGIEIVLIITPLFVIVATPLLVMVTIGKGNSRQFPLIVFDRAMVTIKLLISQVYGICDVRLEFHKWQGEYMTMYLAYYFAQI